MSDNKPTLTFDLDYTESLLRQSENPAAISPVVRFVFNIEETGTRADAVVNVDKITNYNQYDDDFKAKVQEVLDKEYPDNTVVIKGITLLTSNIIANSFVQQMATPFVNLLGLINSNEWHSH